MEPPKFLQSWQAFWNPCVERYPRWGASLAQGSCCAASLPASLDPQRLGTAFLSLPSDTEQQTTLPSRSFMHVKTDWYPSFRHISLSHERIEFASLCELLAQWKSLFTVSCPTPSQFLVLLPVPLLTRSSRFELRPPGPEGHSVGEG